MNYFCISPKDFEGESESARQGGRQSYLRLPSSKSRPQDKATRRFG